MTTQQETELRELFSDNWSCYSDATRTQRTMTETQFIKLIPQIQEILSEKWIDVKNELPKIPNDDAQSFLCQTEIDIKVLDWITDNNGNGKFYIDYRNHFDDMTDIVTHWQPLPKSPKEKV